MCDYFSIYILFHLTLRQNQASIEMDHIVHKTPSLRPTIGYTSSPGNSSFILHVAYDPWPGPLYTLFYFTLTLSL